MAYKKNRKYVLINRHVFLTARAFTLYTGPGGRMHCALQGNLHCTPIGIRLLLDSFPYTFLASARHLGALPAQVQFRWTLAS